MKQAAVSICLCIKTNKHKLRTSRIVFYYNLCLLVFVQLSLAATNKLDIVIYFTRPPKPKNDY